MSTIAGPPSSTATQVSAGVRRTAATRGEHDAQLDDADDGAAQRRVVEERVGEDGDELGAEQDRGGVREDGVDRAAGSSLGRLVVGRSRAAPSSLARFFSSRRSWLATISRLRDDGRTTLMPVHSVDEHRPEEARRSRRRAANQITVADQAGEQEAEDRLAAVGASTPRARAAARSRGVARARLTVAAGRRRTRSATSGAQLAQGAGRVDTVAALVVLLAVQPAVGVRLGQHLLDDLAVRVGGAQDRRTAGRAGRG